MSRNILIAMIVLLVPFVSTAQNDASEGKVHKIVFQLMSEDSVVHKGLIRQLNNLLSASPTAQIEVVCHGPGINFLVTDKTVVQEKIQRLKISGVIFMACESTLKERNISKDKIIPEAGFVPFALLEIILKQEEGWSYIKAGF